MLTYALYVIVKRMNKNKENLGKSQRKSIPWIESVAAFLTFLIIFSFFGSISHRLAVLRSRSLAEILPRVLVDLTNGNRLAFELNQLTVNPLLEAAAAKKAADMAEKSYFAHTSPEGVTPWFWFSDAGYRFVSAGENLAVHFSDSPDVVRAWMNSPSHRANILNQNFTEIGIAMSRGYYQGRPTVFVVQMFGRPDLSANILVDSKIPTAEATETPESATTEPELALEETTIIDEESERFLVANTSEVLGSETNEEVPIEEKTAEEPIVFATESDQPLVEHSNKWERFLVSPSLLSSIVYLILAIAVIVFAIVGFILEFKKGHYRHMIYGVFLLVLILVMYFISQSAFTDVGIAYNL